jgi:[protein-PII] uridylyltransferase
VRTVDQCREEALRDVSTATTLMEARLLDGPAELFGRLQSELLPDRMWAADAFFEAKFAEQQERHARFHETAYNLEPNIKEGPGGLRDIQMIAWVLRHFGAQTCMLVEHGFSPKRNTDHERSAFPGGCVTHYTCWRDVWKIARSISSAAALRLLH